jgi:hypothetical protein
MVLWALANGAAAKLATDRAVPLAAFPGAACLRIHVVANRLAQAVLAKAPRAVLVAAGKHPARTNLHSHASQPSVSHSLPTMSD